MIDDVADRAIAAAQALLRPADRRGIREFVPTVAEGGLPAVLAGHDWKELTGCPEWDLVVILGDVLCDLFPTREEVLLMVARAVIRVHETAVDNLGAVDDFGEIAETARKVSLPYWGNSRPIAEARYLRPAARSVGADRPDEDCSR